MFQKKSAKRKIDLSGLKLAGKSLPHPNIIQTGWKVGTRFTARDDPDRVTIPWVPPAFITYQDPVKRRAKLRVQHLDISRFRPRYDGTLAFARVVHGVFEGKECVQFINAINKKGFTPALINTGGGRQQYLPSYRKGWRMIADNEALTSWLFEVLKPHLPATYSGTRKVARLVDLNERCRFLCYEPGQEFKSHYDGCYRRPNGPKAGHFSLITIQMYLHDVPEAHGGATTFVSRSDYKLPCQPKAGSVLIFTQNLLHEGSLLTRGTKYTLRTEAMYDTSAKKPKSDPETEPKCKTELEPEPEASSDHAAASTTASATTCATTEVRATKSSVSNAKKEESFSDEENFFG